MTDSSTQSGTPLVSRLLAWRPLHSVPTVLSAAVAVLAAAVVSTGFVGRDLAAAQTFVTAATKAAIVLPDGSLREATTGAVVPRGALLRTGDKGGARLTTEGRDVYVGALSTVRVVDGLTQSLERGLAMVDSRSGPSLSLSTAAGSISAPEGSLTRVEQNVGTLRMAVYDGESAITAAGRRATTTVPALRQVRVPYGGVPEPRTALALTVRNGAYDPWEQRLAANLVQADIDLNSFSAGLNGVDGLFVLNAAPASLRQTVASGRSRGEQALAVAVAQKGRLHDDPEQNLREVEKDRADGGSWGVVAAIVKAPVSDVTSVLGSSLDDPDGNGTLAGGPLPTSQPTSRPSGSGTQTRRPTATATATRTPTDPPTTANPVDEAIKRVTETVPTPPAPPSRSPEPTPTGLPVPAPSSGPIGAIIDALLKPLG